MTRETVSCTGGARIGWVNATWPFARLTASRDTLVINATVIGRYTFTPEQVVSIEKYTILPVFGWGLRIHHTVPTYPKKIVFWCFGSPNALIESIFQTGFLPSADPASVPRHAEGPVRWVAVIAVVALWHILFIMDMKLLPGPESRPGWFSFLAVFLVFIGSVAMWRVGWLQRCFLKPGRSPDEIKAWLNLLALVSGPLSVGLLIMLLAGLL